MYNHFAFCFMHPQKKEKVRLYVHCTWWSENFYVTYKIFFRGKRIYFWGLVFKAIEPKTRSNKFREKNRTFISVYIKKRLELKVNIKWLECLFLHNVFLNLETWCIPDNIRAFCAAISFTVFLHYHIFHCGLILIILNSDIY